MPKRPHKITSLRPELMEDTCKFGVTLKMYREDHPVNSGKWVLSGKSKTIYYIDCIICDF